MPPSRPRLLDLFCGAGGCAVGYHRAGFDVTGVDVRPQPRYPFPFVQADALQYLREHGQNFDAVHASPPCQRYSIATNCRGSANRHPDLAGVTIGLLRSGGRPWVVENVPGAPLGPSLLLCGLMFGLRVFRHRLFATSHLILAPEHPSHAGKRIGVGGMVCAAGHGAQSTGWGNRSRRVPADHRTKAAWSAAMQIDWMVRDELAQAIPPAYTEYVGRQLRRVVEC